MCSKRRKNIILLAPVNFLRSYSGFQYLADSLFERGFNLKVFAHVPHELMPEARKLPYPVYSCFESIIGKIPVLRHFIFRWKIQRELNNELDSIILCSTNFDGFFRESVSFKNKYPNKIFIQYCPELWLPDDKRIFRESDRIFYLKNANTPDMIIDVEIHRAKLREQHFCLNKTVYVIPNTLPLNNIPRSSSLEKLSNVANIQFPKGKYLLVFTAVITPTTVKEFQNLLNNISSNIFILWIAHGSKRAIKEACFMLQKKIKSECFHVCGPIPRNILNCLIQEADAGLILYPFHTNLMMNQIYAAPSKLFEYIAAGLPIVSYGNPSIRELVDKYDLGICAKEQTPESLSRAIDVLFSRNDFPSLRNHVKSVFADFLCYDKYSQNIIDHMCNILNKDVE